MKHTTTEEYRYRNILLSIHTATNHTTKEKYLQLSVPPLNTSLLGHIATRTYLLKTSVALSKTDITYVFAYVTRVCNHTRLLQGSSDVIDDVLNEKS